jgi:hypothetical protein
MEARRSSEMSFDSQRTAWRSQKVEFFCEILHQKIQLLFSWMWYHVPMFRRKLPLPSLLEDLSALRMDAAVSFGILVLV